MMHLLLSDKIVFTLVFFAIVAIFYIRTQPHFSEPWKKVFRNPLATMMAMILSVYLIIGLLDCIHFQTDATLKSVLDIFIGTLNMHDEKTYSAPFSVAFNANTSISVLCAQGIALGVLTFLPIAASFIYFFKKNKRTLAWRTGLSTAGILWIVIVVTS